MKKLLRYNLLIILLAVFSCTKESEFSEPIFVEQDEISSLFVIAAEAEEAQNCAETGCIPIGIPETEIALFLELKNDAELDFSNADHLFFAQDGTAYFNDISIGYYTVAARNNLGTSIGTKTVYTGSNDLIITF